MVMEDAEGSNSPSKRDLFPAAEVAADLEESLQGHLGSYPAMQDPQAAAWMQTPGAQHYSWYAHHLFIVLEIALVVSMLDPFLNCHTTITELFPAAAIFISFCSQ